MEGICSICLESIPGFSTRNKTYTKNLTCGHSFHKACIDPWLKDHKNCPYCRQDEYTYIIKWIQDTYKAGNSIYTCMYDSTSECINYRFEPDGLLYKDIRNQLVDQFPQAWVIIDDNQYPLYRLKTIKEDKSIHYEYISYFLRQTILFNPNFKNNSHIKKKYANNGTLSFFDTDTNIARHSSLTRYNYDILFSWAFDIFVGYSEEYNHHFNLAYNSLILDMFTIYIMSIRIPVEEYQTVIASTISLIYSFVNISIEESYMIYMSDNSILKSRFNFYKNLLKPIMFNTLVKNID